MVVVQPARGRPFQGVPTCGGPLLQVVEPQCQGGAVLQRRGRVDEGVGEQLAGFLQVVAVLDGVGQDTRQQAHVLTLGFHIARFEQGQVCEHEGDDSLLGLGLPLADHTCKDTTEGENISLQSSASSCRAGVLHLFHASTLQ